ncbi:phage portal protein [Novosphingobium sp. JCM 18896]|uniref:phage portal protein n=1 Tax=Novosphingobium sp. JCM 18896 TaxID=2989731 RepID=UPI002223EA3D|nr:phage portal protein [Novosphingobium sp. JCM 18896]MCW1431389.1 phage portal protein [Novosphingobium sp. JCM 18896]
MTGYALSREARQANQAWDAARERKSVIGAGALSTWAAGGVSRQNGSNFTTNQVTLAQYDDAMAAGYGNAIGLSATWSCVNLIAGTIASLPLVVYRTSAGGVRTVAQGHPLYYVLHDSPNFDQTALDFWEFMAASIELQGNAYASVERRDDGSVYSLIPIRPDIVTVTRVNGLLRYEWSEGGRAIVKDVRDVLHIRGPMGNALSGASTLAACRGTFASALATDSAARTTFSNGMRPSGVLRTKDSLTREQRNDAERALQEKYSGSINAGLPMVLDRDMQWQQINITPEDAQMLDSRKFSGEEICRIFGVPPAMVGYGDKASNWGTGKEVDVLGFQKFTLRKRLKRIEQAVMKQLLTPADRAQGITLEFNLEGLLRADSQGRAQFYQTMTQLGAMTINEVRALENLPPVAGGDTPRMQSQNVPISGPGSVSQPEEDTL